MPVANPPLIPLPELGATTGVLIPLYIYPADVFTNTTYNSIIDQAKTYHRIPTMVVLNPGSGPGTVVDGNYTAAIKRLRGAGVTVLGYVHTTHAGRALADVKADVSTWLALYPMIDGIFVDEMTNDDSAPNRAYFTALTAHIHNSGLFPSVANPGSGVGIAYFTEECADIIIIYEGSGAPAEATIKGDFDGGYMDVSYRRRGALIYNATELNSGAPTYVSPATVKTTAKYVGWTYVTADTAGNPWDVFDPLELAALYTTLAGSTA